MTLMILGEKIEVELLDEVLDNGEPIQGVFHNLEMKIQISRKAQNIRQTLLHELNHAVFYLIGVTDDQLPELLQEIFCDTIARGTDQALSQLQNLELT